MSSNNVAVTQHQIAPLTKVLRTLMLGSIVSLSGLLVACGGEGSTQANSDPAVNEQLDTDTSVNDNNSQDTADKQPVKEGDQLAQLVLALTDAEEDFISYTIGVNSILLTKDNGDQVEVLPEATQVDFAEYQEVTELFAFVKAPEGKYTSVTMELDYSEAYILVQDENGQTYEAQAVDSEENLITTHQVEFRLAENNELELDRNKPAHLTLDLDLAESNTILSFEPAVVQVEAFVIGDVAIDEDRAHRVRGTISSVDTDAQSVTINMRPMRKKQGEFGEFTLSLNEETELQIDGEQPELSQALTTLSEQGDDYPLVAFGTTSTDEASGEVSFVATKLLAGSSVPWAGKDAFKGMVTKLEQGVSYISGLSVDTDARERNYVKDVALTLSDETSFVGRLNSELDASYLVPGQRIRTLGQYTAAGEVEVTAASFDISGETVNILMSEVFGQVSEISDEGLATVSVKRFNKRPGKLIKRKLAKMNPRMRRGQQPQPNQDQPNRERPSALAPSVELETIVVDISELSQLSIAAEDWVKVTGYMNPEGDDADMDASKVVKMHVSDTELKYAGGYGREGTTPVISADNSSLTLDITEGRHKLNFRFNPVNMMPEIDNLTFVAAAETNKFALAERGVETVFYDSYAELLTELKARLAVQGTVASLAAKGTLNDDSSQLIVSDMVVKLN